MRPESRREQLLTQYVGNELVIYDERTHEAHHLSQTAAQVWALADGVRDLPDLAAALRETVARGPDGDTSTLDHDTSLELARLALSELNRAGLLTCALPDLTVLGEPMSRRQMLGVTATLLPVVASIVAPTPAMAATCQATATANPSSVIPAGGQVLVNITALCGWQVTSQAAHITPAGSTSGSGVGTVTFNVAANTSQTARTGVITVTFPGNTNFINFTISQNGGAETPVPPPAAPVAVISSPPPSASVPVETSVSFDGSGSQGSISSWTWNFGDSSTASGPKVTHSYSRNLVPPEGKVTLTVTLTVTGPGGSNTTTRPIIVFRTY